MAPSFTYGAHINRNGGLGRPGTSDGREGDIVLVGIRNFAPVALSAYIISFLSRSHSELDMMIVAGS